MMAPMGDETGFFHFFYKICKVFHCILFCFSKVLIFFFNYIVLEDKISLYYFIHSLWKVTIYIFLPSSKNRLALLAYI